MNDLGHLSFGVDDSTELGRQGPRRHPRRELLGRNPPHLLTCERAQLVDLFAVPGWKQSRLLFGTVQSYARPRVA